MNDNNKIKTFNLSNAVFFNASFHNKYVLARNLAILLNDEALKNTLQADAEESKKVLGEIKKT